MSQDCSVSLEFRCIKKSSISHIKSSATASINPHHSVVLTQATALTQIIFKDDISMLFPPQCIKTLNTVGERGLPTTTNSNFCRLLLWHCICMTMWDPDHGINLQQPVWQGSRDNDRCCLPDLAPGLKIRCEMVSFFR